MKKYLTFVLSSIMALFMISGCSQQKEISTTQQNSSGNEASALLERGLVCPMHLGDDEHWSAIIKTEDSNDEIYLVKADITEEQYEEYGDIIMNQDEDQDELLKSFIAGLDQITVTDLKDQIPTEEDLADYIGKTVGVLVEEGYENYGYNWNEVQRILNYEGPKYSLELDIEEEIDDIDDLTEDEINELHISGVRFTGFSLMFLE